MKPNGKQSSRYHPHRALTFQDYLGIARRGRTIIIGTLAGAVALAIAYIGVAHSVYNATASVLINTRMVQSSLFLDALRRLDNEKNIVQNELEVLKSHSLAEEVAIRLRHQRIADSSWNATMQILQPPEGADSSQALATPGEIVERLDRAVTINLVPETDVITIDARSKDPSEAALIANTYAESFRDRNLQNSRSKSHSFREFLQEQLETKRAALVQLEDSLSEYMRRYGIISLDDETRMQVDKLAKLESELDAATIDEQALAGELASYREQIPQQAKDAAKAIGDADDPYIRLLQEQLAKLEVQRDVTIAQNPEAAGSDIYSGKLKEIDDQINALKGKLKSRTDEFLAALVPGMQGSTDLKDPAGFLKMVKQKIITSEIGLQALKARKSALQEAIRGYEVQFGRIPERAIKYARLQRAKSSNEKLFLTLQEKYNEAMITEQSQFGYVEIVDPAAVPTAPSSPKKVLILLLAIVGGTALGVAVSIVRERVDVRVQTPEEIRRRDMVLYGTVLSMKVPRRLGPEGKLITFNHSFSAIAESYRHIRTRLLHSNEAHPPRTILVTSPKPGDGKSTTVANLGIAFAQSGRSVLLVDADIRKPNLNNYFNCSAHPGIAEALAGQASLKDLIQTTKVRGLSFIGWGIAREDPIELVNSAALRALLSEVCGMFDIVILDSAPVLAGVEPCVLASLVDETVVVVSAGETRESELEEAIGFISEMVKKVPGIILNKLDLHRAYGIPYAHTGVGYYPYAGAKEKDHV